MSLKPIVGLLGGPLARRLTRSGGRVLMYHRFGTDAAGRRMTATSFEQQLRYLVRHFRVSPLRDVVQALHGGRALDARTVVVTIDDGYEDFREHAYPLLRRFEVPATLFVVTRFVDGDYWLWFDAVHYVLLQTARSRCALPIDGGILQLDLSSMPARQRAWSAIGERCLAMDGAGRETVIQTLQRELQIAIPERPVPAYRGMTWDEIRGLDRELIDIGSHTCTHPVLSRCSAADIAREVGDSRRIIERRLGRPVEAFCYPNGEPADYDERAVLAVKQAGYRCATVAHGGPIVSTADPYRLERIGAAREMVKFRSAVNGVTTLADGWRAWRTATF